MSYFQYEYEAYVTIDAQREKVWDRLIDVSQYPLWNPFTIQVETDWKLHSPVVLTVQMFPGRSPLKQVEYIQSYQPPFQFSWGFRWSVFLKASRIQVLRQKGAQTEYYTRDQITGFLSPMVHAIYGKHIQRGFEKIAQALKTFVESYE